MQRRGGPAAAKVRRIGTLKGPLLSAGNHLDTQRERAGQFQRRTR